MKFSQLVFLCLALCCLVQFGEGVKCWTSKSKDDLEKGSFDKTKLKEEECLTKYCGLVFWYDEDAKAGEPDHEMINFTRGGGAHY